LRGELVRALKRTVIFSAGIWVLGLVAGAA
jgi:hypothetical protein